VHQEARRVMEEVTITLPTAIAASVLDFVNKNMQVQGKEGANALLLIIAAFESALSSDDLPNEDF
jgi:hypothetical protein